MSILRRVLVPSRFFLVSPDGAGSARNDLPVEDSALIRKKMTRKAICIEEPGTGETHWVPLSALVPSNHPRVFTVRDWFARKSRLPFLPH